MRLKTFPTRLFAAAITLFSLQLEAVAGGALCLTTDGVTVASTDFTKVRVWNLPDRKLLYVNDEMKFITGLAFTPDNKSLACASGGYDKLVNFYNLADHKFESTMKGKPDQFRREEHVFDGISSIRINPSQKLLASAGYDGNIDLWSLSTKKLLRTIVAHKDHIYDVLFNQSGSILISASADNTIKSWKTNTGQLLHTMPSKHSIFALALNAKENLLASGELDGALKIWDVQTGKLLHEFKRHKRDVMALEFSPDGRYLATASSDKSVKIWNTASWQIERSLPFDEELQDLLYTKSGDLLLVDSQPGSVSVLDTHTWKVSCVLR